MTDRIVYQRVDPNDPLGEYRSGSTEPWTVGIMCAIVRAIKPKVLLETGTYKGMTTVQLALAAGHAATVHTVDNGDAGLEPCSSVPNIKAHKEEALAFIERWSGPPFDFVFLDDDHKAAHVAAELDALHDWTKPHLSKVAPAAIICVHDVVGHFHLGEVVLARHGFVLNLPLLHAGGGLGIIQIPRD